MNRDDVIKALECCRHSDSSEEYCADCPYYTVKYCAAKISEDALTLIKEQGEQIFKLENRLKECENEYSQTLALERARIKELTEANERLVLAAKMAGVPLPEGLDIINKFCSGRIIDVTKKIFAEINSSLAYVEEQLDEMPDCFLAVKEDIEYLEKKYVEEKSD